MNRTEFEDRISDIFFDVKTAYYKAMHIRDIQLELIKLPFCEESVEDVKSHLLEDLCQSLQFICDDYESWETEYSQYIYEREEKNNG